MFVQFWEHLFACHFCPFLSSTNLSSLTHSYSLLLWGVPVDPQPALKQLAGQHSSQIFMCLAGHLAQTKLTIPASPAPLLPVVPGQTALPCLSVGLQQAVSQGQCPACCLRCSQPPKGLILGSLFSLVLPLSLLRSGAAWPLCSCLPVSQLAKCELVLLSRLLWTGLLRVMYISV